MQKDRPAMMGFKKRAFGPLPPATLDDLVPPDHYYRHLERTLDLGFVRDLVRDAYAALAAALLSPGTARRRRPEAECSSDGVQR
jgi:hypothetical protein